MRKEALAKIFAVTIVISMFIYNPLALIFPFGSKLSSHIFFFSIPHVFIAATFSLAYISFSFERLSFEDIKVKFIFAALGLILVSGLIFDSPIYKIVEFSAFFSVPLAISLATQKGKQVEQILLWGALLIWFISFFYCLVWPGNVRIGFAGNQNWLAASLLSSFLLSIKVLKERFKPNIFKVILGILIPLNVYILYTTHARVLIPVVIVVGLYLCIAYLSKKVSIGLIVLCVLIALSGAYLKKDYIKGAYNFDIRGPLYSDTFNMAVSSPFLGHGPGNFQRDFVDFASDELRKRSVYSPVVEHPHNEILRLVVSTGFPVGALFILLIYLSLRNQKAGEERGVSFKQLTVLSLFVMGMADKALVISSSAIIFLIAFGLILKVKTKEQEEITSHKFLALISLIFLAFGGYRLSQAIPSQFYYWQGEQARSRFAATSEPKLIDEMYNQYSKSVAADPYSLQAHYNKASLLSQFGKNLKETNESLQAVILLEPNYADINNQIANFYMKQASLSSQQEKPAFYKEAESYMLLNLAASPWSIKRNRQLVSFYCKIKDFDKALAALEQLKKAAREKIEFSYNYHFKENLEKDLREWEQTVIRGEMNANPLINQLKTNRQGSYLFPEIVNKFANKAAYISPRYLEPDKDFWKRKLAVSQKFKSVDLNKENISKLISGIDIKADIKLKPVDAILESQQANYLGVAVVVNECAAQKGALACVVYEESKVYAVVISEDSYCVIDCQSKKLFEYNPKAFGQWFSESKKEVKVLFEPGQFCVRNQLLSDVYSINGLNSELCRSPTEMVIRLRKKLNNHPISLDLSFF
ncbi:MAG: O-antigen ligase family protein [Lentisphaeraceae bacterium]|nr:O-antigen ligase family protein [Lentisphaeraceae bacterium]